MGVCVCVRAQYVHTLNVTSESLKHTQTFFTLLVKMCGTVQVLMTTQTERENARYRKDVEKALGSMGSTGT